MFGIRFIQSILLIVLIADQLECNKLFTESELLRIFETIDNGSPEKSMLLSAKIYPEITRENETDYDETSTMTRFKYTGSQNARDLHRYSEIALTASKLIMQTEEGSNEDLTTVQLLKYTAPGKYCPNVKPKCDKAYPYRYIDGSCNNLINTWWGKSETPFSRFLPNNYNDNVEEPRKLGVHGYPLPNARLVALNVHFPLKKDYDLDPEWVSLFTFFGQFLDHDITLTASSPDSYDSNKPLSCKCNSKNPNCIKIPTPKGDYVNEDQSCMAIARSSSSFSSFNCRIGYREQLDLSTSWMDLSQVYGSSPEGSDKLRTFTNGRLLSRSGDKYGEFLPLENLNYVCGDRRCSENIVLQSIQTLFLREHNRIATILAHLNKDWDDERLFQETRIIAIAQYQMILFNEFIPQVIGYEFARSYDLLPYGQDKYFLNYDSYSYPNIYNEFATAAFRYGHTLVPTFVSKISSYNKVVDTLSFKQWLAPPIGQQENKDGYNQLIRGCIWDPMGLPDSHMTEGIFDHINEVKPKNRNYMSADFYRLSLPAVNIARGRDHGLAPYNQYRYECDLKYAYSFDDLSSEMSPETILNLAKTYRSVKDIDLWTGGISEKPVKGGVVGPTFACILAKQFQALKVGDRFYFENGHDKNTRLTMLQLNAIKRVTMARLICDNSNVDYVQIDPFRLPVPKYNPIVPCHEIPTLDLKFWRALKY
jgi:hypothetical protein